MTKARKNDGSYGGGYGDDGGGTGKRQRRADRGDRTSVKR
jgi:hypothetical protein